MATVTDDDGQKRHECDEKCERECPGCRKVFIVHKMFRWGIQAIDFEARTKGGGGVICDGCATSVLEKLHHEGMH